MSLYLSSERCGITESSSQVSFLLPKLQYLQLGTANPSPVHELLAHTKHPFPSSYLHFFDQEYEDLLSTVITLDAEYATMYARLQGFDRIRQMLKTQLNEYCGIRHPIRRLPDEMLAMVFRLCVNNGISETVEAWW
ncbi:hypothetical protein Moror_12030 [Moniliophthora roreri MCA 2997]|uniref:Uncharacterized protein n=1 Tax=Moniliophthora roreri (strain MCA 2997) TaxID=1381753 RepID=V2WTX5_MONRO|nr:hypothetical protein Moror_12030 [Moniliophthora roreri MCA 2997]